jgi:hypothetical protein
VRSVHRIGPVASVALSGGLTGLEQLGCRQIAGRVVVRCVAWDLGRTRRQAQIPLRGADLGCMRGTVVRAAAS